MAAYGAALRNAVTTSLGPVIGGDAGLLADLAAGHDRDVRLDLDHRFGDLIAFARGAGLQPRDSVTLMVRGAPSAARRPCARDRADDDGRRVTITPARQSAPPSSASTGGVSPRIAQPSSTATGGTR